MKRFESFFIIVIFSIFLNGCNKYDDSDIMEKLSSLDYRVASIEGILEVMNYEIISVESLAEALQQRLFVTKVDVTSSNGYSLRFSDGSTVVISHGADGKDGKDAPLIGIRYYNGRYYWVKTTENTTEWLLDKNGSLIPASGTDGVTPLIKVDSDGYWIISYDNGYSFVTLTDISGNAFKASGEDGVSFFDSIEVSDNDVRIVLKDGSEIVFPLGEVPPLKAIDLGLSVKWASFNMGASSETDPGELYYWGDPDNSGGYDYEAPDVDNICGTIYDIARAKWGSSWRLPNEQEQKELIFNCTWRRVTVNGVTGMRITGKNNNSIFLPPTGYRFLSSNKSELENGYYWVGETFKDDFGNYGYIFYFNAASYFYNGGRLKNGSKLAIRPVRDK